MAQTLLPHFSIICYQVLRIECVPGVCGFVWPLESKQFLVAPDYKY
jgi:hypothetical protein